MILIRRQLLPKFAFCVNRKGKMTSPCRLLLLFSLLLLTGSVHGWWWSRKPKTVSTVSKVSGETIARVAEKYIDSTKWARGSWYSLKYYPGTNKCNIFVADVVKEAGGKVPQRKSDEWSPIGAGEWGNARSTYLTNDNCWSHVSSAQRGDVIGDGVHVGIVAGGGKTISANSKNVARKSWGFEPASSRFVLWRYTC